MRAQKRMQEFAQERERLRILEPAPSFEEQRERTEALLREHLKRTTAPEERKEMRRRIAEDLLVAAMREPWEVFFRYLQRLRRLGFSTLEREVWVCSIAAKAARRNEAGQEVALRMISSAERKVPRSPLPKPWKAEQLAVLERLRGELHGGA